MTQFSGAKLTQNTDNQSQKAQELYAIVESIVKKIDEIDTEITSLVSGGLEGNSVQTMAGTYLKNREVISDFVKRFAATACVLEDDAITMKKLESEADVAASGTM